MTCVSIDTKLCKGCERCVEACPQNILKMTSNMNNMGYFMPEVAHKQKCIGCTLCSIACPDSAISIAFNATRYNLFAY